MMDLGQLEKLLYWHAYRIWKNIRSWYKESLEVERKLERMKWNASEFQGFWKKSFANRDEIGAVTRHRRS